MCLKVAASIRSTVCPLLVAKSYAECVSLFENYTDDIIQVSYLFTFPPSRSQADVLPTEHRVPVLHRRRDLPRHRHRKLRHERRTIVSLSDGMNLWSIVFTFVKWSANTRGQTRPCKIWIGNKHKSDLIDQFVFGLCNNTRSVKVYFQVRVPHLQNKAELKFPIKSAWSERRVDRCEIPRKRSEEQHADRGNEFSSSNLLRNDNYGLARERAVTTAWPAAEVLGATTLSLKQKLIELAH